VIPQSTDGTNRLNILQPLCVECDRIKGDWTPDLLLVKLGKQAA